MTIGAVDTPDSRYNDLSDRLFTLYFEGRQRVALELLAKPDPDLEPWSAELAHFAACMHGSLDEPAAALQVLQTASDAGAWWEPSTLTDEEDLEALQSLTEFQELVALSATRRNSEPIPAIIQLPTGVVRAGGVVVALHGAGQAAARAATDWAEVLKLGYALVCVESSQRMSPMYRTWPERDRAIEDIGRALDELPAELRGLPLIAAGFSAGGRAALDWALTASPVPAAGVIVVGPALRELPAEAHGTLSPAVVLVGADDELLEIVDEAADRLTGFGLTIDRVPGLEHAFPQDFAQRLTAILPSCG